ncbi:MAG: putative transposase [Arenicella sp.]|jgi:putative transposase
MNQKYAPGVSNDNPYSESLFRTLKYCPGWPKAGFNSIAEARKWVPKFVAWYNNEHRHSKIKFVTPNQRHSGLDNEILRKRKALYELKKKENASRWSGPTRNRQPISSVHLNAEKISQAA